MPSVGQAAACVPGSFRSCCPPHEMQPSQPGPAVFSFPGSVNSGPSTAPLWGSRLVQTPRVCTHPPSCTRMHPGQPAGGSLPATGLGGRELCRTTACGRAVALMGSSPEAPLPGWMALHVTMATALGILGASGTLLLRMEAKHDRHTGCDHVSRVHFDRQPLAAAETIHLTQRETHQEKPGSGVAPWKPPDPEQSLSGLRWWPGQDRNLSIQGQKVGNVSKIWKVGQAP